MKPNPTPKPADPVAEFVAAIREITDPVAHLTDAELAARLDLPAPVRRLILGLRRSLREYEAARGDA